MSDYTFSKYVEDENSCIIFIIGKLGSGKTTLLKNLVGEGSLYFHCELQHDKIQLPRFIRTLSDVGIAKLNPESSWSKFFDTIFQNSTPEKKRIIAFDNFHNLVKSNPTILGTLQDSWTRYAVTNNVVLFLTGTPTPEVIITKDRLKALVKPTLLKTQTIKPTTFNEFKKYFNGLPIEQIISYYAITGGMPKYYKMLDRTKDIFENIRMILESPTLSAYLSPRILLNYDFHDPTTYFSIMQSLAFEENKIGMLAKRLGLKTHNLTSFLDRLRELGLLERILPATEEDPDISRKGRYRIIDPFHRFWFRYIYSNQDFVAMGKFDKIIDQIKADYPEIMGNAIYEILVHDLKGKNEFFDISSIGRWWDKENRMQLVGLGEKDVLFGAIIWRENPATSNDLHSLIQVSHFVQVPKRIRRDAYLIFCNAGFSKDLERETKRKDEMIALYTLDKI